MYMNDRVRDRVMKYFSTKDWNKHQEVVPVVPAHVLN
jgi:hypothetical protein